MRRVQRLLAGFLLLVCASPTAAAAQDEDAVVVQGTPILSADDLPRACTQAERLVRDGNLTEAKALYTSLLGRADCAASGLADVKAAQEEATAKEEVQAQTTKAFNKSVKKIRALQREGFDDEATKELQKLVAAFPARDIPEDLRQPTQRLGRWRQALGRIGPPVVSALEVLALALGSFVAFWIGRSLIRRFTENQARLAAFDGSDDKELTASLPSALNDHLGRMREHGSAPPLMAQPAAEPDFDLPDTAVAALPQANLLASLLGFLDKLVSRNVLEVKGTIRPIHPLWGAGMTISLNRPGGHSLAQETLWETDYLLAPAKDKWDADLASRYARLLGPAAVWLAYREELGYEKDAPPLGTTNWRSYALLAGGEIARSEGRAIDARRAFALALDHDPSNLGARLNLGALLLRPQPGPDGYPDEDDSAETQRLIQARSLIETVNTRATDWSTALPYRAKYLAAIGDLYSALPDHAAGHIRVLQNQIKANRSLEALAPMIARLAPAVDALSQGVRVLKGEAPSFKDFADKWQPVAAEYNLACVRNLWAERPGVTDEQRRERRANALAHLAQAVDRDPSVRANARLDPALRSIREDKEFADRWNALVREPSPVADDGPDLTDRLRAAIMELLGA